MVGMGIRVALMLGAGAALVTGAPALADVKAGVDAWTAGNYAQAVKEWTGPAAQGDPDAEFNLAQAYRLGRGVDVDLRQAELLYARAAAQGHVRAADNYGLVLFESGRRAQAMPYIEAAAGRGDPRAQYLLGIAHFNGDFVAEDWQRAYALMTLANAAGLPQAKAALAQMDEHIPLADRQSAQTLAARMRDKAEATRQSDLAAIDLALAGGGASGTAPPAASAGADFTRSAAVAGSKPPVRAASAADAKQAAPPVPTAARLPSAAAVGGPWKLQLGAFGVPGNADKLWASLGNHAALTGATKLKEPAGRLTKLLAGGFASETAARKACDALKASGQTCLVTR